MTEPPLFFHRIFKIPKSDLAPSLPVFPLAPDNFSNAGVSAPDADHSIDIRVENGSVYADGCTDLHVYTLDGRQMPSQNLAPGLYIIRAGNVTKKIKI